MTERTTGHIKWFNPARRYGFIRREGGQPDVYVHANDLRNPRDAYRLLPWATVMASLFAS